MGRGRGRAGGGRGRMGMHVALRACAVPPECACAFPLLWGPKSPPPSTRLPFLTLQSIAKQLVKALHYLHSNRIIHRRVRQQQQQPLTFASARGEQQAVAAYPAMATTARVHTS